MTDINWRPEASLEQVRLRASILKKIREFFAKKDVLEVETPLLCHSSIGDPNILSFSTKFIPFGESESKGTTLYLQTSPEFALKRLLAAGFPSIYQICKAFRNGEIGSKHNPEFTILEWYRLGFDHHMLMREMDEFLQFVISTPKGEKISYHEAFQKYLDIDIFTISSEELFLLAKNKGIFVDDQLSFDDLLELLMTKFIEPNLGKNCPTFLYDFPASQAALSRISPEDSRIASRFEVYINGVELANGFHELKVEAEQRCRFEEYLAERSRRHIELIPIDERFLAALKNGLPDCAGVALGIDRLLMSVTKRANIAEVLTFSTQNA